VTSKIHGGEIVPLRRIADERGTVLHMLRRDDPHFQAFDEIHFSTVYPGVVKGWHIHREMTLNYAVPLGRIKLVLYDDRSDSPTHGTLEQHFLGPANHAPIRVPPTVWNGLKGMGTELALVANCATRPHDPDEIGGLDPFDPSTPYDSSLVSR
jgi:dTDP-4-dehydrorhamnose 3,5-epimerase